MDAESGKGERFVVDGNRLVITSHFDPRLQRGAESELLETLEALIEERQEEDLCLDLHRRRSLPSMLIGLIVEAKRRTEESGRAFRLRIHPEHLKTIEWTGVTRIFPQQQSGSSEDDSFIELSGRAEEEGAQ